MIAVIRLASQLVSNGLATAAQYRVAMAFWSLSGMLQVVVFLSVWSAVANAHGGSVAGYDAGQFAGYFIVLLVVREMTYTWTPWVFADEVKTGNISSKLMIPLHPVWRYVTDTVVFKLQSVLVVIPAVIALALVFHPVLHVTVSAVATFVPLILLAAATRFAADWTLAQAAFWLTRLDGIRNTYYIVMLFLGGQFAPIGVLPEPMRIVAKALPFYWALGFPVELILGRTNASQLGTAVVVLSGWLIVLTLASRALWARGIRAHGSVGL
ncbi:MAG: ABC-2 family transporter protein [Thermoleophilia bacterium]|nr:ABC-2 family transporter protein [Thermoleophilia bacterium]